MGMWMDGWMRIWCYATAAVADISMMIYIRLNLHIHIKSISTSYPHKEPKNNIYIDSHFASHHMKHET